MYQTYKSKLKNKKGSYPNNSQYIYIYLIE